MRKRNSIKGRLTGIILSVVMTVSSVYIPAYAVTPDENETEAVVTEESSADESLSAIEDVTEAADEKVTEGESVAESASDTEDTSEDEPETSDETEEALTETVEAEEGETETLVEQESVTSDTELYGDSIEGAFTFDSSNVLTKYTGTGGDIIIPAKTTKIASNVFQNKESITSVTFAGTKCKEIGYSAFSGCSSLRSVTIPDTVTIIGSRAFYHTDLSEIALPSGLTDMGSGVFEGNPNLKKVTVNSKITSDPDADCFKDCKIESIIFGSGVNGIAVNLFNNATFADGFLLTVPDGILTIGESAFYGSNISGIRFTSNSKLKEIGDTAFLGCTGIKELTLPASVQKIGRGAFAGNDLTEITLPAGLREISLGAFKSNTGLSRVTLNSTELAVNDTTDNDVFDKCKISEIRFGDDVTVIPARLFRKAGFADDTIISIPANIKEIEYNAFSDTTIAGVSFAAGSKLEVIGEGAFYNCAGIEAIELPASLKTIHKNAFYNNSLAEITIPASVTKIESEAFLNNTGLKKVTVNSENIELDTYPAAVFGGCQVENIVFGPNVTKIPAYLFRNSKFADGFELVVPARITSIGAGAFNFDTVESTLYGLSFEDGSILASIGDRAFYGCKYIEEVSLPETVTYIGESAFSGCDLRKVVIPSKVSFLGSFAFEKNTELAEVDIRTDKIIDKNYNRYGVFLGCRIGKITLCDSMPYIPNGLFDNCGMKKDTSVVIPSSVTSIHQNAFGSCKNLTDIYMGSIVKEMVEDPFSYGYSISDNGSKDLTFHAPAGSYAIRWAKEHGYKTDEITVYKVTYNLNGGTNAPGNASEYVKGKGFDLQDPVKKGNSFEGWYTTSDFAEGTKITRIEGDKDITVYAKWKADIAETSVSVSPAGGMLYLGESMLLTATVLPDNATHKDVTWTSSDTAIATVKDNGNGTATVLPVANGSVKITVTTKGIGNKSATCYITVDTKVTSIKLVDPNTGNNSGKIQPGKTLQLKPVFNEGVSEPTDKSLIWVSSNAAVASVSSTGKITAKSAGTVKISAYKGREVESEYFTVTVYEPIKKITLNKSKLTLGDGDIYDLDVVIPDHLADQSYVWSTSDELIVQVDSFGYVTAHLPDGFSSATATVTAIATDGSGTYATCKITVGVPIESIDINVPKSLKYNINGIPCVAVGKSVKLSAVFNPLSPANKNLVWSSMNESVAKVDAKGNVKALSPGCGSIKVKNTESGKNRIIPLYVYSPLKKLALNENKLSIKQGDTFDLETIMTPADATFSDDGTHYDIPKVIWTSSDPRIATVDAYGNISALNLDGKDKAAVRITASATSDGNITKTAVCNVTVYVDDVKISKLGLSKTKLTIGSNAKTKLSAKITPASATNRELDWSSDNEAVATVSGDGTITAHSAGTAVITVSAKDGSSKKSTCKVTVGNPATEINIKAPKRLAVGKTFVLKAEMKSGTGKAANKEYTWINDTPDLINIDKKGKVTVKDVGTAKITIKAEPVTDEPERITKEISFDTYIPVSKLSAEKTKVTMFEEDSGYELHYIIGNYEDATNKDIKWTSSNADIVMISDGSNNYAGEKVTNQRSVYIRALKPGTAKITGITTDGSNKKVTVTVKVLGIMHYEDVGIKVTSQPKTVTVTDNETLHVEVKNLQVKKTFKIVPMLTKTATDKTVTYYSMDSSVATVSKTGVVTAKGTGSTRVYMYTSDGGHEGYVEVTVVK